MSFESCVLHRLSRDTLEKCHNSAIYEPISTLLKLTIKFHQYGAFSIDFVAYLEIFEFCKILSSETCESHRLSEDKM